MSVIHCGCPAFRLIVRVRTKMQKPCAKGGVSVAEIQLCCLALFIHRIRHTCKFIGDGPASRQLAALGQWTRAFESWSLFRGIARILQCVERSLERAPR